MAVRDLEDFKLDEDVPVESLADENFELDEEVGRGAVQEDAEEFQYLKKDAAIAYYRKLVSEGKLEDAKHLAFYAASIDDFQVVREHYREQLATANLGGINMNDMLCALAYHYATETRDDADVESYIDGGKYSAPLAENYSKEFEAYLKYAGWKEPTPKQAYYKGFYDSVAEREPEFLKEFKTKYTEKTNTPPPAEEIGDQIIKGGRKAVGLTGDIYHDVEGLTQRISLDKLGEMGKGVSHQMTIVDLSHSSKAKAEDKNILLAVTQEVEGKTVEVATFSARNVDGKNKVYLTLDPEFQKKFAAETGVTISNPLPLERVTFSQSKGLEIDMGQIAAGNKDVALLFSALGMQARTADGKRVMHRTVGADGKVHPYNFTFTSLGFDCMAGRNGVPTIEGFGIQRADDLSKDSALFTNLLVQRVQADRFSQTAEERKEPRTYEFNNKICGEGCKTVVHSVPFSFNDRKGKPQNSFLTLLQETTKNGNTEAYAYFQTTANSRATTPQKFKIVNIGVEADNTGKPSFITIQFSDKGKPRALQVPISRNPDGSLTAESQANLNYLYGNFPEYFNVRKNKFLSDGGSMDASNSIGVTYEGATIQMPVYKAQARDDAPIVSFETMAQLSLTEDVKETEQPPEVELPEFPAGRDHEPEPHAEEPDHTHEPPPPGDTSGDTSGDTPGGDAGDGLGGAHLVDGDDDGGHDGGVPEAPGGGAPGGETPPGGSLDEPDIPEIPSDTSGVSDEPSDTSEGPAEGTNSGEIATPDNTENPSPEKPSRRKSEEPKDFDPDLSELPNFRLSLIFLLVVAFVIALAGNPIMYWVFAGIGALIAGTFAIEPAVNLINSRRHNAYSKREERLAKENHLTHQTIHLKSNANILSIERRGIIAKQRDTKAKMAQLRADMEAEPNKRKKKKIKKQIDKLSEQLIEINEQLSENNQKWLEQIRAQGLNEQDKIIERCNREIKNLSVDKKSKALNQAEIEKLKAEIAAAEQAKKDIQAEYEAFKKNEQECQKKNKKSKNPEQLNHSELDYRIAHEQAVLDREKESAEGAAEAAKLRAEDAENSAQNAEFVNKKTEEAKEEAKKKKKKVTVNKESEPKEKTSEEGRGGK